MKAINSEHISLLVILSLSAILRFSVVIILKIEPVSDAAAYMNMAISMLDTGDMRDGSGNVAFYSSGYPLFLIPFLSFFGRSPEVVQFVNATLGVVSILLVYLCAKRTLPDWRWSMAATVIWATYPPAILYTEYVAKENLMVTLLLLQTLILLHYPESEHRIKLSLLLGIVFGAQLLVGPAVILTGMLVGLIYARTIMKNNLSTFSFVPIFVVIIGCAIVLAPWLSYTNKQLGTPVLNNNGSFNLYLGNNPSADVYFVGIQDTPMGGQWNSLRKERGELEAFSILKEKATDYILENPGQTAWLSLKKIAYFWFPPIHEGEGGNQSKIETLVRFVWLLYYCFIVITALLALVFFKKLNQNHFILLATVVLYCVVHAAAYIIFRYRLPIMPFMCILSMTGLHFTYCYIVGGKGLVNLRQNAASDY